MKSVESAQPSGVDLHIAGFDRGRCACIDETIAAIVDPMKRVQANLLKTIDAAILENQGMIAFMEEENVDQWTHEAEQVARFLRSIRRTAESLADIVRDDASGALHRLATHRMDVAGEAAAQ